MTVLIVQTPAVEYVSEIMGTWGKARRWWRRREQRFKPIVDGVTAAIIALMAVATLMLAMLAVKHG